MARQVRVLMSDDIDGSEASQTVRFGLDGSDYEIDLNDANATALREVIARYASVARRISGRRGSSARVAGVKSSSSSDVDPVAVRAWAQENGIEMSPRGRISTAVLDQYRASRNAPAKASAPAKPGRKPAAKKPAARKPARASA